MKGKFKLVGLSRNKSVTCETNKEDHFWPKVEMSQERFDALWDYCEGHWDEQKYAVVEYEKADETGEPINGILIEITTDPS